MQLPARLEPAREWRLVTEVTLKQLARASELVPLQAQAAIQIDAAEHAFNTLIAECAKIGCTVVPPTMSPVRELVRELPAAPAHQPIAA